MEALPQSTLKLFWGFSGVAQLLIRITDVGLSSPLVAIGMATGPAENY